MTTSRHSNILDLIAAGMALLIAIGPLAPFATQA
jgi:hypothetical protein